MVSITVTNNAAVVHSIAKKARPYLPPSNRQNGSDRVSSFFWDFAIAELTLLRAGGGVRSGIFQIDPFESSTLDSFIPCFQCPQKQNPPWLENAFKELLVSLGQNLSLLGSIAMVSVRR